MRFSRNGTPIGIPSPGKFDSCRGESLGLAWNPDGRFAMSRITLATTLTLALVAGVVAPAYAAKLPKGDTFWTVSDATGGLQAWNPKSGAFSASINGPGGDIVQYGIIGGGWDAKKKRFLLVDGWGGGTSDQGLLVYDVKTETWTRFAIDLDGGNTYGFQVRDVASNSKGKLFLLVKNQTQMDNTYTQYIVPVTTLNSETLVASAPYSGRVQIFQEYVQYSSIAFDPTSNGRIFAMSLDYTMDLVSASAGAVLSSRDVESTYDQSVHFDIDSSRHYWAFGGNGAELLYGLLGSENDNASLRSTGFTSSLNCLIIQRKAK